MRLIAFTLNGKARAGAERDGLALPFARFDALMDLIASGADPAAEPTLPGVPLESVRLIAPIPSPRQDLICLGLNYQAHMEESQRFKKETFVKPEGYPVYFSKRCARAVDPFGAIQSHRDLMTDLDYECELAVVIGREAKRVSEETAFDFVFGYTIVNDVSARTLQNRHKQWYFGKSLDGFTPLGPAVVTRDEFGEPPILAVKSFVNGEPRQNGSTRDLIYGIPRIIAELSRGMTLLPGTVIATGTPAGVGMGMNPPRFLNPGDEVVCEIEGIGRLVNRVE